MSYSRDFAPGSKVCCDTPVIGTSHSPTKPLPDNTYYWRVRAVDVDGNVGVWNPSSADASRFEKVFDKAAALGRPSISNLHMRDDRNDPAPAGPTQTPVVGLGPGSRRVELPGRGRPALGALRLERPVAEHGASRRRRPRGRRSATGSPPRCRIPTSSGRRPTGAKLVAGRSYCVRVRAKSDTDSNSADVYGDFTYLNGPDQVAFTFAGYPCTIGCSRAYIGAGDYLTPQTGRTTTPYFTWGGSVNAGSWFVIVAKDPEFHNIVDYAWTQVRAYAPRAGANPITYPDETTSYYWAVLPAAGHNGASAVGDPLSASAAKFDKQSTPPRLVTPTAGAKPSGPPGVRLDGRRRRPALQPPGLPRGRLREAARQRHDCVDHVYGQHELPGRRRALLARPSRGRGGRRPDLVREARLPGQAGRPRLGRRRAHGDFIPTWRWRPVQGAVTYDMHVALPDGSQKDFRGIRSSALTATKMTGTGVFRWRVRANFPKGPLGHRSRPLVADAAVHPDAREAAGHPDRRERAQRPLRLAAEGRRAGVPSSRSRSGPTSAAPPTGRRPTRPRGRPSSGGRGSRAARAQSGSTGAWQRWTKTATRVRSRSRSASAPASDHLDRVGGLPAHPAALAAPRRADQPEPTSPPPSAVSRRPTRNSAGCGAIAPAASDSPCANDGERFEQTS